MKNVQNKRNHILLKQNHSPLIKVISWILIFAFFNLSSGCMNYFHARKSTGPVATNVEYFYEKNKTLVIHVENNAWVLEAVEVQDSVIYGKVMKEFVPILEEPPNEGGTSRVKLKKPHDEASVLNEVHIYCSKIKHRPDNKVSILVDDIYDIKVYEFHKGMSAFSSALGYIGFYVGATLAAYIVLLATSCPFIYVPNGDGYQLIGEIYSGSIQASLERHDFLKLPNYNPNSTHYQLKIANELKEIQHTNLMELWVFDHDQNTEILIDKYNKVYALTELLKPLSATSLSGNEVETLVEAKDDIIFSSSKKQTEMPLTDGLILEFPKPTTATNAQIIIKAKNSLILDYMMAQFQNQFGDLYNKWYKQQSKKPAEHFRQWSLDQNIPLSLLVERNGQWEYVDYYNVAGPVALKDDILSFALDGTESNPLKVKLEFGNFFWEIDYVAVNYSEHTDISYTIVPIHTAINEKGKDVGKRLREDDNKYYDQPERGNNADLVFEMPASTNEQRTIYLHSKGWYKILRETSGTPDKEYLQTFRQAGEFNKFVNENMLRYASQ